MVVMGGPHSGVAPVGEGASRRVSATNTKQRVPESDRRGEEALSHPSSRPVQRSAHGRGSLTGAQRSAWRHRQCLNTLWCTSYGKCSHSVVVAGEDSSVSFGAA